MNAKTAVAAMLEDRGPDSLDARVHALADEFGVWCYRVIRGSERGWPDLVLIGKTGIVYRELKTEHGTLTPEQRAIGDRITKAGGNWRVYRPRDYYSGLIARELAALGAVQEQLF